MSDHADVLVQTDPEGVAHKRRENMDNPDQMQCYWTVSGTPRKTGRGGTMLFSDGSEVWGTATITEVEDGKIWFTPIRAADGLSFDLPIDPPTRGFAYITDEMFE